MASIKKGQIYVDENGQVMTVQKTDDTGIHVDEEGQKKKFMDETEFEEYRKKKKYEKSNVSLDDEFPEDGEEEEEEEVPEPPMDDEEGEEEEEVPEPPAEEEPEEPEVNKKDKFKELYLQMLDLGATGNDKIDKAVEKLKKELSSELNTMTSESWDQVEQELKLEGYID